MSAVSGGAKNGEASLRVGWQFAGSGYGVVSGETPHRSTLMPYRPLLVKIDASSSLQLALEKVLQLQDGPLSADEKREVAVLRLQVALARWNAEKARVNVAR